jgi:hypothetical protein
LGRFDELLEALAARMLSMRLGYFLPARSAVRLAFAFCAALRCRDGPGLAFGFGLFQGGFRGVLIYRLLALRFRWETE